LKEGFSLRVFREAVSATNVAETAHSRGFPGHAGLASLALDVSGSLSESADTNAKLLIHYLQDDLAARMHAFDHFVGCSDLLKRKNCRNH
jgi:hypothetical protein